MPLFFPEAALPGGLRTTETDPIRPEIKRIGRELINIYSLLFIVLAAQIATHRKGIFSELSFKFLICDVWSNFRSALHLHFALSAGPCCRGGFDSTFHSCLATSGNRESAREKQPRSICLKRMVCPLSGVSVACSGGACSARRSEGSRLYERLSRVCGDAFFAFAVVWLKVCAQALGCLANHDLSERK